MLSLALSMTLCAAPFPLPAVGDKAPAVAKDQTEFRLPMRFERVRAFYELQFGSARNDVLLAVSGAPGERVLTLSTKRKDTAWTKAVITEGEMETKVKVKLVTYLGQIDISGNGKPAVQFIIGRSGDIDAAVDAIGKKHLEQLRH